MRLYSNAVGIALFALAVLVVVSAGAVALGRAPLGGHDAAPAGTATTDGTPDSEPAIAAAATTDATRVDRATTGGTARQSPAKAARGTGSRAPARERTLMTQTTGATATSATPEPRTTRSAAGTATPADESTPATAAETGPTVTFPNCTAVRIQGLNDSSYEVEYVSLVAWDVHDWSRRHPEATVDTYLAGLPENDTGPTYSYVRDGRFDHQLYAIESVALTAPNGSMRTVQSPRNCSLVVGLRDDGTVAPARTVDSGP
ncbi:MAG: hypothetical protein ABEJ31_13625 [Haloarculaceae archaeon]